VYDKNFICWFLSLKIYTHAIKALLTSHKMWGVLPFVLRNRDPTSYPWFNMALTRATYHLNYFKRYSTRWIGPRFHYPLIWCRTRIYMIKFQWNDFEELTNWVEVDNKLGYYEATYLGYVAFIWTNLHT